MTMDQVALLAGLASTTLFVISYLPMLYRALKTRDLGSYSRPSLVLANVGNVVQAIYVYNLPVGPIWFLHGFYLGASALMLGLHYRHFRTGSAALPAPESASSMTRGSMTRGSISVRLEPIAEQGGRHDGDHRTSLRT